MGSGAAMEQEPKRSEKRRLLIYYLKVFSAETGELLGHVVDITHSGVMVLARQPFENGWEGKVRVELPFEHEGKTEIHLTVVSRWHRKDVNPQYFLTGFQVTAAAPSELSTIDYLISECAFQG
jgi:hypothetical protein